YNSMAVQVYVDGNYIRRLVEVARRAGETWRRWDNAMASMLSRWALFEAYQRVLDTATELRERSRHPDADTLVELSALLSGPSVELPEEEVPLRERTLLGPKGRRVTLEEAVTLMIDAFEFVKGEVAA